MQLTSEQHEILQASGNLKINAVAGSGKTSTLIEYARTRPKGSRLLYLAFNKTVKEEAKRRFAQHGIANIRVETAHSLAYKSIVLNHGYQVNGKGYNIHEIVNLLGLNNSGEKHAEYILANHINKFIAYFCNSAKTKVSELDYLQVVSDPEAKAFVASNYSLLEKQTRKLLKLMNDGAIGITHDFYLKKYQLSQPELPYDYLLFDEGQDASAAMLEVFLKQNGVKVIVGDTHQQIYGWRYAINSLEKTDFDGYQLTTSFRFGNDIAALAHQILSWKNKIKEQPIPCLSGLGVASNSRSKAVIARTNVGLLLYAIDWVLKKKKSTTIYFEGNINSYTYADEGASLYDVLNLYNHNRKRIRDPLISQMRNMSELEEYIEKTEDIQLRTMVELVKEYDNQIPDLIKTLKEMHVSDDRKAEAEVVFSTVHRCKGMEYDEVLLANDFLTESKLDQLLTSNKQDEAYLSKLTEEINLLYVAITRTRNLLHLPIELLPAGFPDSKNIKLVFSESSVRTSVLEQNNGSKWHKREQEKEKKWSLEEKREKFEGAYLPWTDKLDQELKVMFRNGVKLKELTHHFKRSPSAIRSRIKKLELDTDEYSTI